LDFFRIWRMTGCRRAPPALVAAGVATLCAAVFAADVAADASAILLVNLPWVRPGADARSAELFMEIKSTDGAALVGASSFAAGDVTLLAPGKAPKAVGEITLPANAAVQLAPGAYRIALRRLTHPLKIGDHVPVSLTIQSADGKRQELLINAEVRRRSAYDDEMTHPHKH
jgi:copper(I)-binding protein